MMDRNTWNSLNDNTKKHWDCIKQAEKVKILNYALKRASNATVNQNNGNRVGGFNTSNNNLRTNVNTHDLAAVEREFIEEGNDKLEVGVHQLEEHIELVCNGEDTSSKNLLQLTKP